MKFKAYPFAEIFDLETKVTHGRFDKKGFYETEDKTVIKAIKALGYEPMSKKDEDNSKNLEKEHAQIRDEYSKLTKRELLDMANDPQLAINGADKMTKDELLDAIVG